MITTKNTPNSKKDVIIIGRINLGKLPIGGETSKNQALIITLQQYCNVYPLDFYKNKQRPWIYIQTIWVLLVHPNASLILSSTASNVYFIMKIHKWIKSKRNIIHLCVGGEFAKFVSNGRFSPTILNSIKANLVQSESMNRELIKNGVTNSIKVSNSRIICYRPSIDKRIMEINNSSKIRFVYLSRIMKAKGVDHLLEAVQKINSLYSADIFEVDFYGVIDQKYKTEFLEVIGSLSNAKYRGVLNLKVHQGYDTLAKYHCMVFPTFHPSEGFAGVFIDAFISGLPVITTRWNANAEIIEDGINGILIKPHSTEAVTSAMLQIINRGINVERLSRNSQLCSEKYDAKTVFSQVFLQQLNII